MKRTLALQTILMFLFLGTSFAHARLRCTYEDATVVERSELIVVAHLKAGSIEYVPHKKTHPEAGASWEHHATLVIGEVLKGKCAEKEIPITIHYGLDPLVGGYFKNDNHEFNFRGGKTDYPKDIIEIFDTGNSVHSFSSLVKDARDDNLWFLRRIGGIYGTEPGTGNYGIVDPEDIRPIDWKEYCLAYLSDNPEKMIREYVQKNPDKKERAKRYLDHLEVQQILKIEDPKQRYERLLPFFLSRQTWNLKSEARDGIVSCGATAGEKLKDIFTDPQKGNLRQTIIQMWQDIGYREVAPLLIDLLKQHDQFWAEQQLQEGWWNKDVGSKQTRQRQNIYGEVYRSVVVLRLFHDENAREVLEMTKKRWEAIAFENKQILEECNAALHELAKEKKPDNNAPKAKQ
jgi:hypothetical protein